MALEKVVAYCLLGDEDVARSTYYQTTVQCLSTNAVVWVITKEDFLHFKYSKPFWDILETGFTAKLKHYCNRLTQMHNTKQSFGQEIKVGKVPSGDEHEKSHQKTSFYVNEDDDKRQRLVDNIATIKKEMTGSTHTIPKNSKNQFA